MLALLQGLSWREALFSLKSFAAAMLALWVAFRLDLPQPSWSVTTAYVVSQPLAGMVLAKSLYRVLGTVIGAVMSLVLVALLSNAPELFCLALALWIGAGTAVSIYLRDAPQAYVGMLSGYSAAIIGLPAALAPDTAFDFALARCIEIMIGISCGTLLHHLVFPQRAGDTLIKAVAATLPGVARWVDDSLLGRGDEAARLADLRRVIAGVVGLDQLRVFATLDTPQIRVVEGAIRQFQGKLLSLLALLVSVRDRVALLRREHPEAADALAPLLARAAAHVAGSAHSATPLQSHRESVDETLLRADLEAALPRLDALQDTPDALLLRIILLRLRDIVEIWREAVWIRTHIDQGVAPSQEAPAPALRPYRDPAFALTGGAISAVTVMAASLFWIVSAWPNGATAVTFAGIMCAIMGARDNPAAGAAMFLKMSLVGAAIAAPYLFVLLPTLDTFPALVLALAPFYLACGLLLAVPRTVPMALPVIFAVGGLTSISNHMTYDFDAFINNVVAYVVGIAIGGTALALLRPVGQEVVANRLVRGLRQDLARLAAAAAAEPRSAFESRMFDRINALLVQLDPAVPEQRAMMQGALAGLRLGLNVLTLQREHPRLPLGVAVAVERALAALSAGLARPPGRQAAELPAALFETARNQALSAASDDLLVVVDSLAGIQTTLDQHLAFFFPGEAALSRQVVEAATA